MKMQWFKVCKKTELGLSWLERSFPVLETRKIWRRAS